jgi:dTDP-4-amino-4,6-dideoxygalactose transaminase
VGIPFVDLGRIHAPLKEAFMGAFAQAIDSNGFVMGKALSQFEEAFATYCEAKHAVGVASGTDALVVALRAADVGPGDEVITVPNSFIATAAAVRLVGATPVFVDVDETTQLMDAGQLKGAMNPAVKAVIPVHLYGHPADMDPVFAFAAENNLVVIEDSAQAHGAKYKGKRIGGLPSFATCFSFYPGKNLGSLGEGGAVTTNDEKVAARLKRIRDHGSEKRYDHSELGTNARLHAIQASFLTIKLAHLDSWNDSRRQSAARYTELLKDVDGVTPPTVREDALPVFHLYVVRVPDRDACLAFLQEKGIGVGIHYPVPIHLQGAFKELGYARGSFPVTERLAGEIISLPMFPGLTEAEIQQVVDGLKEWSARPQ